MKQRVLMVVGARPPVPPAVSPDWNAVPPVWKFRWDADGCQSYRAEVNGGALAIHRVWDPDGGYPGSLIVQALAAGEWTYCCIVDEVPEAVT